MKSKIFYLFFILISFNFIGNNIYPVPPSPELIKKFEKEGISLQIFSYVFQTAREAGVDQPGPLKAPLIGTRKALVLLVDFTDKQATTLQSYFQNLLFTQGTGSMRDYFAENSYGQFDLQGDVRGSSTNPSPRNGWYQAPQTYAYYVDGKYGLGTYPKNTQKLVEDVINLADQAGVNFADYDADGDGWIDALFVVHAGLGAEETGNPNDIWSHKWNLRSVMTVDGVKIYDYTIEPELSNISGTGRSAIGVFCHEISHFFGLPDLYDYDNDSQGVGYWSLMAAGCWLNRGNTPGHLDGWSKITLGWVNPVVPTSNQKNVQFPDVETNPVIYKLWKRGEVDKEYFLVENRQKIGFDSYLPGSGLLIYHIDENMPNNNDQTHYKVAVEQADGKFDLERNVNSGDDGDPWPGSSNNRNFTNSSIPNSLAYDGSDSYVRVENISDSGTLMTADITVSFSPDKPVNLFPLNGAKNVPQNKVFLESSSYSHPLNISFGGSHWQIRVENGNYNNPVYDSGEIGPVTSIKIPENCLELGKTYYWHVKYKDVEENWSEWSDETCFTTGINVSPEKPKNLSPSNGATNISLTPTLTASEFRDYDGDSFYQAEWAIYEGTKEIYNTRNKLTYLAVGEGILDYETTYSWCVRYSDIYGNWSLWSNKTSFTTIPRPPIPPETPVNIYPVEINGVELNPTLKATAFLDQNKGDTFKKSYWQIREANNNEKLNDGTYINPYWEKEAGPVNYIKVDRQLKPNTKYYWHVKYQDSTGNWSSWSEETYFITKDGTQTIPTSGGGCFIASVCFGEDSWQVKILRNFRDKILVKSILGKNIVSLYYKISPKIAETLKINNFLKILVKVFLYPIIIFVFLILEPYLFIFLVFVCIIFYNELKRRKKYEV